jgi:nitrilase
MQHIAREGRCWVLSCGVALERKDLPSDFPDLDRLYPLDEEWINPGDSVVIAPGGELISGPINKQKMNLIVEIDVEKSSIAKRTLDVAGHYSRADIFTLEVNRKPQKSMLFGKES